MSRPRVQIRCEQYPVLSETFVVNEAAALSELGHDVEVLAHVRPEVPGLPAGGVPVHYAEDDTTATRLRALARLAVRHPVGVARDLAGRRRWRKDERVAPLRQIAPAMLRARGRHVHVHFAASAALDALRLHRITGARYSVTAHAYDIYARPANLAEKLGRAAFVTTGCEYTARDLRPLAAGRVHVVVMGVDPYVFARSRPPAGRRTVVAVGRLVEKKGFVHLVRAAARPELAAILDEVRIVGDGPLHGPLRAEIERLGLADVVTLVGPLPPAAVRDELTDAAVLAMPSVIARNGDRDSLPVVVKEAMAMEVPVVASEAVGLPELVGPATGRLVAPGDAQSLAAALAELLALAPSERAAIGRRARERVMSHAALGDETAKLSALLARHA